MKKTMLYRVLGVSGRAIVAGLLLVSQTARGGLFPAGRLIDWTQAGVDGGIPTVSTVYTNLGTNATTAQINAALAAAPSNTVVQLANGVYNLTLNTIIQLPHSGVVLRGAGMTNTTIVANNNNASGGGVIVVGGANPVSGGGNCGIWAFDHQVNWTNGFVQGTSNLWVSSTNGLTVGQVVGVDQIADEVMATTNSAEGDGDGRGTNGENNANWGGCNPIDGRIQENWFQVKAINGFNVTVWPPIVGTNWAVANSPQMFWMTNIVQWCGVESLTINATNSNTGNYGANVYFISTWNCWEKNVQSLDPQESHVTTQWGGRTEVRHSYFYGTQSLDQRAYGFQPDASSWNRCEDNIFCMIPAPAEMRCGGENVFAYNFLTNCIYDALSFPQAGMWSHEGYHDHNLYEGNYAPGLYWDDTHGSGGFEMAFRNVLTGLSGDGTAGTTPVAVIANNWYENIVGNILGSPGTYYFEGPTTSYSVEMEGPGTAYTQAGNNYEPFAIYQFGYGASSTWTVPNDPNVFATAFMAGNYDVVSNAVVWWSAPAQSITNSLAYSSEPSWWTAAAWPPYDPNNASAASYTNIPAGYRAAYGVDPTAGPVAPPLPPTNLIAQ